MVLATDMKQHFSIVGQFTATAHRRGSAQQLQSAQGREGTTAGADVPLGAVLSHKEGAAAGGAAAAPGVVGSRKSMDKARLVLSRQQGRAAIASTAGACLH